MPIDLEKLADSEHLLDVLIQVEDVFDSIDMYCFPGWFDTEVVEGPEIRRHWVSVTLLAPYRKMPDPRAIPRLLKHDLRVEYSKVQQAGDAYNPVTGENPDGETFWMIKVSVPRRLLDQMAEADLETYDDAVDTDDVEDAKDSGIDDESAYHTDEKAPMMDGNGGMNAPV